MRDVEHELDGTDGRARVHYNKERTWTGDRLLTALICVHGPEGRSDLVTPTRERP